MTLTKGQSLLAPNWAATGVTKYNPDVVTYPTPTVVTPANGSTVTSTPMTVTVSNGGNVEVMFVYVHRDTIFPAVGSDLSSPTLLESKSFDIPDGWQNVYTRVFFSKADGDMGTSEEAYSEGRYLDLVNPVNITTSYSLATPEITQTGSTSITLEFEASENVTGKTEVRVVGSGTWVQKAYEQSYTWSRHIQTLTGLVAETDYEYRVTVVNRDGDELTYEGTFTTGESLIISGWDNTIRHGGHFYGSTATGWRVNHNWLGDGQYVAIRFIADETGNMVRISKHNRQGTHYSVGAGGAWIVTIHPSVNGWPDESTVLGTTGPNTVTQQDRASDNRYWLDFDTPAPLVAGTEYWQIWYAQNDKGYGMSIFNSSQVGDYYQTVDGITDRGPWLGPDHMKMYSRAYPEDPWGSQQPRHDLIPWVNWQMSSGRIRGTVMDCIYGQYLDDTGRASTRTIEGGQIARQTFVAERDLTVDGMWLSYGHSWKKRISASLHPLTVTFRNSSLSTIATGSYSASQELSNICYEGEYVYDDVEKRTTRTWNYTDFSADVVLTAGQTYHIDFSSPSGGAFTMTANFPWRDSGYDSGVYERTQVWTNASAIITSEGRWTPVDSDYPSGYNNGDRELPILMTIKGRPKRMY